MADAEMVPSPSPSSFLFEACVDSLYSALQAQKGGAGRLELCSNLLEGGTTPSYGLIKLVKEHTQIPVHILIRPRGGDFCYTNLEIKVMREDIEAASRIGVEGVVLGILTTDGHIHIQQMKEMVALCKLLGISLSFHRAFDFTVNVTQALETLIDLGIPRVLTSGQCETVVEGIQMLQKLVELARGRISIMPGGGVTEFNAANIIGMLGVLELHGTARSVMKSDVSFTNPKIAHFMAMNSNQMATDAVKVRKIINACMEVLIIRHA